MNHRINDSLSISSHPPQSYGYNLRRSQIANEQKKRGLSNNSACLIYVLTLEKVIGSTDSRSGRVEILDMTDDQLNIHGIINQNCAETILPTFPSCQLAKEYRNKFHTMTRHDSILLIIGNIDKLSRKLLENPLNNVSYLSAIHLRSKKFDSIISKRKILRLITSSQFPIKQRHLKNCTHQRQLNHDPKIQETQNLQPNLF